MDKMNGYRRRHLQIVLDRLSEPRKCIQVLAGPRQVGKSTLMEQVKELLDVPVFSFNADAIDSSDADWIVRSWASARSRMQMSGSGEAVLVIDEIQKIDNWSEFVKREWDADTFNRLKRLVS